MSDAVESGSTGGTPRRKPRKLEMRSSRHTSVDLGYQALSRNHRNNDDEAREEFERRDSELPSLPVDDHSYASNEYSFMNRSDALKEDDSMDDMRAQLMDVESSFIPDVGHASAHEQEGRLGVDDTYLELGRAGRTPPPDVMFGSLRKSRQNSAQGHEVQRQSEQEEESPETPADAYKTPAPGHYDEDEEEQVNSEGGEVSPSSPAAAAARRGHARNVSTASTQSIVPVRANSISVHSRSSSADVSRPTSSSARPTSKGSTMRPDSSPQPHNVSLPVSEAQSLFSFNAAESPSPPRLNSRPSYFGSRNVSYQSTASTNTLSSGVSSTDTAVNADYALQTGGAMSSSTTLRNSRAGLMSRLPSFGSVMSYSDGVPSLSRGVSGNILTSRFGGRLDGLEEERPETPRASAYNVQAPTDTVLAQRVESIQVPETVARDFRAKNRSPERPSSSGGANLQDRQRKSLTFKEQNSRVDKLTKENFDLKLKIHFLDQALQSRSDDGVKELIDKNVQFQTDLANERKESQGLRRRIRELERRVQEQEDGLAEALQRKSVEDDEQDDEDDPTLQAQMHEEILYLRQQLDHTDNKVTTLTEELMTKELEKRKMAEHMRGMAGSRGEDTAGMKETMDMWQDLLNAETGRREQAEEDIRKLREELSALRIERASPAASRVMKRRSRPGYQESMIDDADFVNGTNGTPSDSSAALTEQLKHENAELRRDLGAQTSMLTSRNRERERLQQEIEDLKLIQRKSDGGRSVAGESIFERSISRAHQRPPSRGSVHTQVTEAERDDWDKKEGQLRDQNAELRLKFQELERTHSTHLQYVTALEGDYQEMEQQIDEQAETLQALQSERDEVLQAFEDKEGEYQKLEQDYDKLKQEALAEIDNCEHQIQALEAQLEDAQKKLQKTRDKLEHTTDGYKGLQGELREITQSVMNLEDEKQTSLRSIQTLEQQLAEAEDEIGKWEMKCNELDQKNRKLEITQESLHSEITFLREEQEGDKIKIGELEDALNAAQQTIQDEQEKLREMEEGIVDERHQRDVLENQSKEEVQKVLDDLNIESGRTKDDVRKLRRALSAKEVEASTWKQKLEELEQALRNMLGEPDGNNQTLLAEIQRLQRELESTANLLDRAKMDAADKDRLLRHRDGLLESTSLESRRLSDLLDKERATRRHDLEQFEKTSRGQASHMREIAQHQSRVLELESAYSQDKRKMAALEQQYRDQLGERNNLLLALWNRLSTLCGTEWAQAHSLIDGKVPSSDVIQRNINGFNKNIISAIKRIESVVGGFKVRMREVEKAVWRDYQTLQQNFEMRMRRMDALEKAVIDTQRAITEEQAKQAQLEQQQASSRPGLASRTVSSMTTKTVKNSEEMSKLKSEVKLLKSELKFHREHPSAMAQQMLHQQAQANPAEHARRTSSGGNSTGKGSASPARAIVAQLLRHHSTSAVEQLQGANHDDQASQTGSAKQQPIVLATPPIQPSEQRWIHRLKELERRLKAEREARLLDRRGARQRLEEGRQENEELRQMLEREKVRHESYAEGSVAGSERRESLAPSQRDVD